MLIRALFVSLLMLWTGRATADESPQVILWDMTATPRRHRVLQNGVLGPWQTGIADGTRACATIYVGARDSQITHPGSEGTPEYHANARAMDEAIVQYNLRNLPPPRLFDPPGGPADERRSVLSLDLDLRTGLIVSPGDLASVPHYSGIGMVQRPDGTWYALSGILSTTAETPPFAVSHSGEVLHRALNDIAAGRRIVSCDVTFGHF